MQIGKLILNFLLFIGLTAQQACGQQNKTTIYKGDKFTLEYPNKKATIEISFIGYKTLEFDVSGIIVVDVKLGIENARLDEVIFDDNGNRPKRAGSVVSKSIMIRGASLVNAQTENMMMQTESDSKTELYINGEDIRAVPAPSELLASISARKNFPMVAEMKMARWYQTDNSKDAAISMEI